MLLIIFFFLITPIAMVMRLSGRDELRLQKRKGGSSWVSREEAKVTPESFNNQY
jgi:hypothetical protein